MGHRVTDDDVTEEKETQMKKILTTALIAVLPLVASPAIAADELNVAPGLSAAGAPLALHGADPVALLDSEQSITGTASIATSHDGATYYFASEENQAAFEANPARYVAQNGGFCTYGVSVGKKFDGDPREFVVHDGKLFVFLNAATRKLFLEDKAGVTATANEQWAKIEHIAAGEL